MQNFNQLISTISQLHKQLQKSAVNAVNQMLTIRNWLFGYYIVEFEQNGADRAKYGTALLKSIAGKLKNIKGLDERSLRSFRQFYLSYPQLADTIWGSLTPILEETGIRGSLTPELVEMPKKVSAGMDENLFVQQYMLILPDVKILKQHIEKELKVL